MNLPARDLTNNDASGSQMPTTSRYRFILDRGELGSETVDRYTRLIPIPDLHRIIRELESRLAPAGLKEGASLAKLMVKSYSRGTVADADTYTRAIVSIFAEYPKDLGWLAVDDITRTQRWLPERADVYAALSRLMGQRKRMLRAAKAHLFEHQSRQKEQQAQQGQRRYGDLSQAERSKIDQMLEDVRRRARRDPFSSGEADAEAKSGETREDQDSHQPVGAEPPQPPQPSPGPDSEADSLPDPVRADQAGDRAQG